MLAGAARAAASERPGQRARAWRRIEQARSRAPARKWLATASAAAACAAGLALLPRPAPLSVVDAAGPVESAGERAAAGAPVPEGARVRAGPAGLATLSASGMKVALSADSALRVEDGAVRLEEGMAAFRISSRLAEIRAGAMRIQAAGATFVAEIRAERVAIHVEEGAVEVEQGGQLHTVAPRTSWSSQGEPSGAGPAERAMASLVRAGAGATPEKALELSRLPTALSLAGDAALERRAHEQESAGRFGQAAALYAEVGAHATPRAEAALYQLARLRLRSLQDPAGALAALDEYRRRFPAGLLTEEVALTAVEARLAAGDERAALQEMDAFLLGFGGSERAAEVRELRGSLLRRLAAAPR
jgi:hypothetical protein